MAYQDFKTELIFPLVTYSPDQFSYLKVVHVLSCMKTGGRLLPSFEKKHIWQPLTDDRSLSSTAPSCFSWIVM